MPVAFGIVFVLLNITELVLGEGGWPQIVGLVLGFVLIALGIARHRGQTGVRR